MVENVDSVSFDLIDFNTKRWQVDYREAFIPPRVLLEKGESVKLIGEITQEHKFYAKEVRPWEGRNYRKKWMGRGEK